MGVKHDLAHTIQVPPQLHLHLPRLAHIPHLGARLLPTTRPQHLCPGTATSTIGTRGLGGNGRGVHRGELTELGVQVLRFRVKHVLGLGSPLFASILLRHFSREVFQNALLQGNVIGRVWRLGGQGHDVGRHLLGVGVHRREMEVLCLPRVRLGVRHHRCWHPNQKVVEVLIIILIAVVVIEEIVVVVAVVARRVAVSGRHVLHAVVAIATDAGIECRRGPRVEHAADALCLRFNDGIRVLHFGQVLEQHMPSFLVHIHVAACICPRRVVHFIRFILCRCRLWRDHSIAVLGPFRDKRPFKHLYPSKQISLQVGFPQSLPFKEGNASLQFCLFRRPPFPLSFKLVMFTMQKVENGWECEPLWDCRSIHTCLCGAGHGGKDGSIRQLLL
eukprot:m.174755 g.174755  ORF g.174755 m.174755 type:complete len:388 (+) comp13871_c0_seq1:3527-4690(+)